jgi:hypothetical protein
MAGNQTVLVAVSDVSADRKPVSTGGYNRDISADRKPVSTGGCSRDVSADRTADQY